MKTKNGFADNSLLLQDHMHGNVNWILFSDPVQIVCATHLNQVNACLREVDDFVQQGFYAAGYISYEASSGIDSTLTTATLSDYPILWFGIYKSIEKIDFESIVGGAYELQEWLPNISRKQYDREIGTIKEYIRNGDTYQVNYTFRMQSRFSGDPISLFKQLVKAQSSEYCAYVKVGNIHICSASPELFFNYDQGKIVSKPMKGTIKRGVSADTDIQRQTFLRHSIKNRAENVMIVDMIRNDMGRFAVPGSVHVDKLFAVECYPTVFQMTSTVSARTDGSAIHVLRHMFPCASITGAPKVRTMQIIKELEKEPRGIYTGSIGYFGPDGTAQLNVAIRTVVINTKNNTAEYGVGGGVVWDSSANDEFEECKLKAEVLTYKEPPFELLETLLWTQDGHYVYLEDHLNRLIRSARYFNFVAERKDIEDALQKAVQGCQFKMRVRLTLKCKGEITVCIAPLNSIVNSVIGLATSNLNTQSKYIYNKTTNRTIYNNVLALSPRCSDVVLINQEGMVTESCVANLVIEKQGHLLTPSYECGLMNGIFRMTLLRSGLVEEAKIFREDIKTADKIYLINSVRGWMPLEVLDGKDSSYWKVLSESGPEDVTFASRQICAKLSKQQTIVKNKVVEASVQ